MQKHYFLLFIILATFFSCAKHEMKIPASFKVEKGEFEDAVTISGYVEPTNSFTVACPSYVDGTIISIVEDGSFVKQGDVVCVLEDKSVLEDLNEITTQLKNAELELEKLKANQAMQWALMEAQVKTNFAETEIANLDSLQLKFNSPVQRKIRELELKKILIQKDKLQRKQKSLQTIQKSEIRRKEYEIKNLTSRLESVQKRVDEMTLKSPVDGMVIKSTHYITAKKMLVGDPVWNNMPLLYIPVNNQMKVKINASEGNFKRMNEKDTVEYLFDAMPDNWAKGTITKKSPVGRPVAKDSKVKIFEIEASIDQYNTLPDPGFTCNCKVVLKRVKDTIVVPNIAVFERDSMKVVYVIHPKHFELRQVKTGLSSPEQIIITHGLHPGELIALSEPDKEFITHRTIFKKLKKEVAASKTKK